MASGLEPDIERVFREHYGRAIAVLVRTFDDIDLAEEAVGEAFATAAELWPAVGLPPSPAGWIITTARNRAIDHLRREGDRSRRHLLADMMNTSDEPMDEFAVADDQLRLIFTCCHPALATNVRVALTLQLVGGLRTPEIARAFLVSEAAMAQRLVRAKAKIRDAKIPYRVPDTTELPSRLGAVLAVIYLIFNEGYAASSGDALIREDLCAEAIRLGRLLVELMPGEQEVSGLLALMLLVESRRSARVTKEGRLVPLAEQDRSLWNRALITEAQDIVRRCVKSDRPGMYQIQAAINAVHSDVPEAGATDWKQILELYDLLSMVAPSPIVTLNRAVALAEVRGPETALAAISHLQIERYYLFHAIRGDFLERLSRPTAAKQAYETAMNLTDNIAEREFLRSKMERLDTPGRA